VERRDGYEVLGATRDDAAGEALDRAARMMGLGYPGGAAIDRLSRRRPQAFDPVAMRRGTPSTSASAGSRRRSSTRSAGSGRRRRPRAVPDLAASFQSAVVRALLLKLEQAIDRTVVTARLAIGEGSPPTLLRREVAALCERRGPELKIRPPELCTDNAAMIASAANFLEPVAYPGFLAFDAFARSAA
jgi:N6-L-threonylcarbamoyladenine synthase